MKRFILLTWVVMGSFFSCAWAQDSIVRNEFQPSLSLDPINFGFRYDDNVFRTVSVEDRQSDEAYFVNFGGDLNLSYDVFKGQIAYHLGADQYQLYSVLNNLKNSFSFSLGLDVGDWNLTYRKDYFVRACDDPDFNYFDDGNYLEGEWSPETNWSIETTLKNYSRAYYEKTDAYQSREFADQSVELGIQKEMDSTFSLKIDGTYNNRLFNRYMFQVSGGVTLSSASFPLQTDETWTGRLSGHLYVESVLQNFVLEHQRTNSNSYGFSNTVESFSWAAVVRPVPSLYLELFFRLYSKVYDVTPITGNSDLQIGYVDEDSQDLLSVKTSWEWSPQWTASFSVNRVRNESTQPGVFYIKNILSLEVQRNF